MKRSRQRSAVSRQCRPILFAGLALALSGCAGAIPTVCVETKVDVIVAAAGGVMVVPAQQKICLRASMLPDGLSGIVQSGGEK